MKQYVVDAFTDRVFSGNQAAVCALDKWLPEAVMMDIARENNFSETAFLVKEGDLYHLRWFTPAGEIELCGHATLASSYVVARFLEPELDSIRFTTLSGILTVRKEEGRLAMDLPAFELRPIDVTPDMARALGGIRPVEAYMGLDMVCVLEDEEQVRAVVPDQEVILGLEGELLHVTARGRDYDCETRSFAPKFGIAEDPVCGRGHCHVVPLWTRKLGREALVAHQASRRGGTLYCRMAGDRVRIAGHAALFSVADIFPEG